ncbi:MAG: alkaline phosphatase family protein [Pyrinomonadaceae bacterium]
MHVFFRTSIARRILVTGLCLLLAAPANWAQRRPVARHTATQRPRLVLLIAVDQFRYDYLTRFGDLFVANGFNRLLRGGASWVDANYDHVPTYTAPGHATMMTGAWPAETGIIANEWPDRVSGRLISNASDPEDTAEKPRWASLGGGPQEFGRGPRRLMASTLGDELRLATNGRSKVIGISLKDRAAIMPAGRHANGAYWFSDETGGMETSTYYFPALPKWVATYNENKPADKYFGAKWERLLPDAEYLRRAGADAPVWEKLYGDDAQKDTNTFPHVVTGGLNGPGKGFYGMLDTTPYGNELVLSFAKQALINEALGQDDDPDVLTVSLSANDYVGHRFGPYSQEAMDITLRTDRELADFLNFIDANVGLDRTLIVFTADHGVAPTPENSAELGLGGDRIRSAPVVEVMRKALKERFGSNAEYIQKFKVDSGAMRDGFYNGQLYLDLDAIRRDKLDPEVVQRVAGEAALTITGTVRYFTRAQLMQSSISPSDPVARRVAHGFYPTRSGDVILIYDSFKISNTVDATTHGSPYTYDTHVPLVIMGGGIRPGIYYNDAAPSDIAPTLAVILGVQKPSNATGRILLEGLTPAVTQRRVSPSGRN